MAKKEKDNVKEDLLNQRADEIGTSALYDAEIEPEDRVDVDKIKSVLAAQDISGGYVRLQRKGPVDATFQYLTKVPVEQFDIDHIKKTFGGGDYKAQTFRANGQMYKPFEFSIDYRFKGAMDEGTMKSLASGANDTNTALKTWEMVSKITDANKSDDKMMFRMMEMQSSKSDQMMALLMTQMAKSQEMQTQMMTNMMTAMATIMSSNRPQGGDSFSTALTPILIKMIDSNSSRQGSLTEALEVIKSVKEIVGPGSVEDKEEDMISKIARLGMQAVAMVAQARSGQVPGQQVPQIPQTSVIADTPQQPNNVTNIDSVQQQVQSFIFMLIHAAERGSDPSLYYDMVVDNLDDNSINQLKLILVQPDWTTKLFENNPRVMACLPWFESLRQLFLSDGEEINANNPIDGAQFITEPGQAKAG